MGAKWVSTTHMDLLTIRLIQRGNFQLTFRNGAIHLNTCRGFFSRDCLKFRHHLFFNFSNQRSPLTVSR